MAVHSFVASAHSGPVALGCDSVVAVVAKWDFRSVCVAALGCPSVLESCCLVRSVSAA